MFTSRKRGVAIATALTASAALALTACSGGGDGAETVNTDEAITLNLTFWGDESRADLYGQAIDAFEDEYPNITVNSTFLTYDDYWEKRQTEAAGGNLPDVIQMDYSYLRQYSENGMLYDLTDYLGDGIDTSGYTDSILDIGKVGDETTAIAISTNAWGLFQNETLLEDNGLEAFAGGSYDDYYDWGKGVTEAGEASGTELYGISGDTTSRIQNFELYMRANGTDLFSEDGEPQFTQDDLKTFWESGQVVRDDIAPTAARAEEVSTVGVFGSALAASEMTWDNFGAGYRANLGDAYPNITLTAPPSYVDGAKDLYLKPSMLYSLGANTEHPAEAAALVDFLVNSEEAAKIFGTNRGLPASQTQLDALELDEVGQQIKDYEASIADRLGDAPPVPIVGYGTLESKFLEISQNIAYGTESIDDAVAEFFSEMDVVLNQ